MIPWYLPASKSSAHLHKVDNPPAWFTCLENLLMWKYSLMRPMCVSGSWGPTLFTLLHVTVRSSMMQELNFNGTKQNWTFNLQDPTALTYIIYIYNIYSFILLYELWPTYQNVNIYYMQNTCCSCQWLVTQTELLPCTCTAYNDICINLLLCMTLLIIMPSQSMYTILRKNPNKLWRKSIVTVNETNKFYLSVLSGAVIHNIMTFSFTCSYTDTW